jgi:hypothetical protein
MLSTQTNVSKGVPLKFRAAFYDDFDQNKSAKFSFDPSPLALAECRYRLRDTTTGKLLFDFDNAGSKMSIDSLSSYSTLQTDSLPIGIPLAFEYQITTGGEVIEVSSNNFRLVVKE